MQQIKYQTGVFLGETEETTRFIEDYKPRTRRNEPLKYKQVKSNTVTNRKHSTENKMDK